MGSDDDSRAKEDALPSDVPPVDDDAERSGIGDEPDHAPAPVPRLSPRRRITSLAFLVFGGLVAWYLGTQGPQEQHVRVVLGAAAPDVTEVGLLYYSKDGDMARETRFVYPRGGAPRVVSHEPQLSNGEYRLQIEVDARDGRRAVQRQVTLGGGSTQIDVSTALTREEKAPEPQ